MGTVRSASKPANGDVSPASNSPAIRTVIAQAGDQMAQEPGPRTIADSPDQSLEDRDAGQQHLVGDEPCRRSIDQGAGPVVTTPAQGIEPSGQTEPCRGIIAEVGEAAVRPDESQVPNAPASLETTSGRWTSSMTSWRRGARSGF